MAARAAHDAPRKTPWLLLLLVTAAAILGYRSVQTKVRSELHQVVTKHLETLFPDSVVYVGRVTQASDGSVTATDVRLALPDTKPRQQVFQAQRVEIRGRLELTDWLQDQLEVRQVDVFGAHIDAWPIDEKHWSVEAIVPKSNPNKTPPKAIFHRATLRIGQTAAMDSSTLTIHEISGTLQPAPEERPHQPDHNASNLASTTAAIRSTKHGTLGAALQPRRMQASFTGKSTGHLDRFQFSAIVQPETRALRVLGNFDGLRLSASLKRSLPAQFQMQLSQLNGLTGEASAAFELISSPQQPPVFRVRGNLVNGQLRDARLPYPLDGLECKFSCENSQIQLREMVAASGRTQLTLNCDLHGLTLKSPMTIVATAQQLPLDDRLYQSLPAKLREQWNKMQPSGTVSGNIKLVFDGQDWTPSLSVYCEDVAVRPWLFPYPLTNLQGHVTYHNKHANCDSMSGRAGGQNIRGNFSLQKNGEEWIGRLACASDGPVAIDELLINALTPRDKPTTGAENFVRQLSPIGTITLSQATFTRNSLTDRWHREIDAHIYNGGIKYDRFAYPIYDIRGRIVGQDDRWWLDRFEGRNDTARILCSGTWLGVRSGQIPLDLTFDAHAVPVEEELKAALPDDAQHIWNELRPAGSIDRVSINIRRATPTTEVHTTVSVFEESASNATTGRSLQIHPRTFPYALTDVDCEIDYQPGKVTITQATGINGNSRLAIRGTSVPSEDGRWKANVEWLPQTRLIVDSQLLKALPESIRQSLVKLDFHGPISVMGKSEAIFPNGEIPQLNTSWDCQLALEDGKLADGKHIGALRGTIWMQGQSNGSQLSVTGSLFMDSLTVMDIPVTRLSGPFALISSNLYFGDRVQEVLPQVEASRNTQMTARALAGTVSLSGHGRLDIGKFYIDANLESANLSLLLQDLGVDSEGTDATCDAQVSFNGVPWNPQTYDGSGHVHLTDAQLYELPFMIRLMQAASVNEADTSAFQTANIQFEIVGDRIPLQVWCDGEVLRLKGDGWTNLRKELYLELFSYVGRRVPISKAFTPLLAESRYATFMLIQVEGSLDNPIMERKPFPQLEATIQQIFPEFANKESKPLLPWRR